MGDENLRKPSRELRTRLGRTNATVYRGGRSAPGGRGRWALAGGVGFGVALLAMLLVPFAASGHVGSLATGASVSALDHRQLVNTNFSGNFTITHKSVVNNVTYLTVTTLRTLTGDMSGTFLAYEWGAIQANGSMWVSGTGTFVGTILGSAPGLATISWQHATGTFGGSLAGFVLLSNGQKGLSEVSGTGSVAVQFTGGYSFAGSYTLHVNDDGGGE